MTEETIGSISKRLDALVLKGAKYKVGSLVSFLPFYHSIPRVRGVITSREVEGTSLTYSIVSVGGVGGGLTYPGIEEELITVLEEVPEKHPGAVEYRTCDEGINRWEVGSFLIMTFLIIAYIVIVVRWINWVF